MTTNGKDLNRNLLTDRFGRTVDYVRISVTGACNLRCTYCLREEDAPARPVGELDTAQIKKIIRALGKTGIRKVRFTGGEPLLRRDLEELVAAARNTAGIESVKLTTNGLLLERRLLSLLDAGLGGINLSLDTLDASKFLAITRRNEFEKVRRSLDMLLENRGVKLKINTLLLRGINQDEIPAFAALTRAHAITVRFMELQPFDDHQIWRTGRFMGADMIREHLYQAFPDLEPITGHATEHYSYRIPGHLGSIAIIPAYSRNFCSRCTRLRITADGRLVSCLYHHESIPLMPLLQADATEEELRKAITDAVMRKPEDGRNSGDGHAVSSMSQIGG